MSETEKIKSLKEIIAKSFNSGNIIYTQETRSRLIKIKFQYKSSDEHESTPELQFKRDTYFVT